MKVSNNTPNFFADSILEALRDLTAVANNCAEDESYARVDRVMRTVTRKTSTSISVFKTDTPRFKSDVDSVAPLGSHVVMISTGMLKEMIRVCLLTALQEQCTIRLRNSYLHTIYDLIQFMHDTNLTVYEFDIPKTYKYQTQREYLSERFQLKNINHRLENFYHDFDMYGAHDDKSLHVALTELNLLP